MKMKTEKAVRYSLEISEKEAQALATMVGNTSVGARMGLGLSEEDAELIGDLWREMDRVLDRGGE